VSKKTYWELLKDPRWQRRRLEILNRADFSCELCDNTSNNTIHVHHKIYRKGKMPWDYVDSELIALCETCHTEDHVLWEMLKEALAILPQHSLAQVVGFAQGLTVHEMWETPDIQKVPPINVRSGEQANGIAAALDLDDLYDARLCRPSLPMSELLSIQIEAQEAYTAQRKAKLT
jgi:hypothetical protein